MLRLVVHLAVDLFERRGALGHPALQLALGLAQRLHHRRLALVGQQLRIGLVGAQLVDAVGGEMVVPRIVTSDVAEAEAFMKGALSAGHEGVVAKAIDAPYEAGRRGASWVKVKSATTLDLVVLAVEWGHGRRQGKLSNIHLGARDPRSGGFVMLGKTFKGMTDEMLAWQTREFLARETHRDDWTVYVRPELVVEVAFDDIQSSPRYEGGLALRFARVKGYRPDKRVDEADTIETVRELYENRREGNP